MRGDFAKEFVSRVTARLLPAADLGGGAATAGLFFAKEKEGRQKILVFDARRANCDFEAPPSTRPPLGVGLR